MSSLSDFESDLTDLESSEDEYRPAPGAVKQPSKRKPPKQEYRLNNTLSPPRNTSYPAMALYNQLKNGLINLDPEYQRGVVWADSKQSYLIDSLFRNYYIPPIIFAVTRTSDGLETRVCIDGKQRLTSIMKFMEGEICHKDSYTGERLWFKQPSSTKKPLLPKQYILQFENKQIPCVEYDTLNDDQEREIFQRVQMGVALTPAERMQALTGQYPDLARDIQKMISGDEGFSDSLEWRDGRGRDFQCIASMIYLVDSKSNVKFPGAPTLDKWLQENREVDNNFRSSILNTFNTYITLAKDARYNACFQSRKVSPVEFTMAAVLIHRYKSTFSMDRLSASIKSMREHVRNEHEDIRANAKVALTITNFIDNDLKKIKPQKGEITATEFMKKLGATAKASKSSKRKRVESTDDEGNEVLRKPPKSSTAGTKRSVTLKIPAKSTAKPTTSSSMSSGVARQVAKRSQPVGQSSPSVTTASKSRVGSGTTVQTVSVKKEKVASSGGKVTSTTQRQKESTSRTQEIARPKPSSSKNPTPGDEGPDAASYTTRARPPTPRKEHVRPSAAGSGHIASTSRASPLQPKQSSSATPPIPGPSPEVKSFAPTSSVSAVANGVMKNEPSRKVSPITTSADGKPDRLAAIRRAKEEQQQRRMSSDAGKAGSSRQGSTSLPATPVTPFQPPPFSQQPLTQSPVTDQNHSKQLPQQMIPQANTSPALLPAAPKPSDIFVLPSGEKLDYQYVVDVLASLSQSPQAATAQAPNLVPAAADPRLARQSPSVTSHSLSRNRTAQEDEDMEIDTPPPQQLPPISPKSNVQPAPVPEAPASQLTPAPASAPAPAPQPAPQNQQSTNPLSFLRQSPVVSVLIPSSVQQRPNHSISTAAAQPSFIDLYIPSPSLQAFSEGPFLQRNEDEKQSEEKNGKSVDTQLEDHSPRLLRKRNSETESRTEEHENILSQPTNSSSTADVGLDPPGDTACPQRPRLPSPSASGFAERREHDLQLQLSSKAKEANQPEVQRRASTTSTHGAELPKKPDLCPPVALSAGRQTTSLLATPVTRERSGTLSSLQPSRWGPLNHDPGPSNGSAESTSWGAVNSYSIDERPSRGTDQRWRSGYRGRWNERGRGRGSRGRGYNGDRLSPYRSRGRRYNSQGGSDSRVPRGPGHHSPQRGYDHYSPHH